VERTFQINLRGVIELLSNHLYSGPSVFVRELLQNAVDALTARAEIVSSVRAIEADRPETRGVRVHLRRGDGAPEIVFEDDGIGLTEGEVHTFLATIGESSKRRVDAAGAPLESDLIGQFGIGILACFLVSDEIVVRTRSARMRDAPPVEWRGRQDGTYAVRVLDDSAMPAGTCVSLRARDERADFFTPECVRDLLSHYGALLRWPIDFVSEASRVRINATPPPWRSAPERRGDRDDAILGYGRDVFGVTFMDWIPLRASSSGTQGIAFVLPEAPSLAEVRTHRMYLKGMLVSDRSTELVPSWAFFVRCVMDSERLRPTASREALYEDERLQATREELGVCIRAWLLHLATHDPRRLTSLIAVHHRAIKALAADDDDVLALFVDHLPFETTSGMLAFSEIRAQCESIQYAPTVDAFRQMAPIASAQSKLLVNGGYSFDAEVLRRGAALHEIPCEPLEGAALTEHFDDPAPREEAVAEGFVEKARKALARFGCDVAIKSFRPEELPAFYATSGEIERRHDVERTRDKSGGLWSDVLGAVEGARARATERPLLCLNLRNPVVRRLATIDDEEAVTFAVSLLYVHALLLGHRPLRAVEQQVLPTAVLGLISWGLESRNARRLQ
jgi:molecular chaperone HtpG